MIQHDPHIVLNYFSNYVVIKKLNLYLDYVQTQRLFERMRRHIYESHGGGQVDGGCTKKRLQRSNPESSVRFRQQKHFV